MQVHASDLNGPDQVRYSVHLLGAATLRPGCDTPKAEIGVGRGCRGTSELRLYCTGAHPTAYFPYPRLQMTLWGVQLADLAVSHRWDTAEESEQQQHESTSAPTATDSNGGAGNGAAAAGNGRRAPAGGTSASNGGGASPRTPSKAQKVVLLKFLRARQWNVAAAVNMLVNCLRVGRCKCIWDVSDISRSTRNVPSPGVRSHGSASQVAGLQETFPREAGRGVGWALGLGRRSGGCDGVSDQATGQMGTVMESGPVMPCSDAAAWRRHSTHGGGTQVGLG